MTSIDWLVVVALIAGVAWAWHKHAELAAKRDKTLREMREQDERDAKRDLPTLEDFRARAHRGTR